MRSILSLAVVALAVGWLGTAVGQVQPSTSPQDAMLAEMKKCAVCKHMAEKPELVKNMTWETHKIDNGMLCLTTVPKEMKKDFAAVNTKMMQAIAEVTTAQKQGRPVELCEFCSSMGALMQANAKEQHIETQMGAIHLMTSNDPATVAKIHAVADKAIAEQKKMQEQPRTTASR